MIRIILLIVSFLPLRSLAHPGVGIVQDGKGNIFYTDLKQVLRISPDGIVSVAVRNVHTHELFLDDHDNLFGEHLWYNGEKANTWGYYVWKLTPDGTFSKLIPDKEGFRDNYSFVRDHFGRMYWPDRTGNCQKIIRKNADDSQVRVSDHCFSNIRWMQAAGDGTLYVVDFQDLKRVDNKGNVKTVASRIADRKISQFTVSNQNSVMGVWDDREGNLYTAVASGRMVKKFTPAGKEMIAFETSLPWSPSGGLVDAHGNLWVLEFSITNAVRVERVGKDGRAVAFK